MEHEHKKNSSIVDDDNIDLTFKVKTDIPQYHQQQDFTIPFLNVKKTNRTAFYISFLTFTCLTIAFSVLAGQYSANAYIITGIIISAIGTVVSMIRISLSALGFVPSTTKFLRVIVFLWECYFGITTFLLFVQNIIVVGMIVVMAIVMIAMTWFQIQVRYGKEFMQSAKQIFENDSDEGETL